MSKYGVISGQYFPVFGLNTERYRISPHSEIPSLSAVSPNTGKYGPEITPYLDTFHAVTVSNNTCYLRVGDSYISIFTELQLHRFTNLTC